MRISIKKIIKILEDTERDFRKAPDPMIHNESGLCWYIQYHKLLIKNSYNSMMIYLKTILGDHCCEDYYTFCGGRGQDKVWENNYHDMKYERADWAEGRLELFRGLLKTKDKENKNESIN